MVKKIKKKVPIIPEKKASKDLLSFIEADKRETRVKAPSVSYKDTPSLRPEFRKWKKKKEIDKWGPADFLGFYLNKYVEIVEEEDLDFKRANTYKFTKEKNCISSCLKTHFNGDREKFKEYIDFIVEWWMSDDSFVDTVPSIWSIFTVKKGTFVKIFISEKIINKKVKRKDIDNKMAEKESWDEYFKEG